MNPGEQKMIKRGVAAGILVGLAVGGIIALAIILRPGLLTGLIQ